MDTSWRESSVAAMAGHRECLRLEVAAGAPDADRFFTAVFDTLLDSLAGPDSQARLDPRSGEGPAGPPTDFADLDPEAALGLATRIFAALAPRLLAVLHDCGAPAEAVVDQLASLHFDLLTRATMADFEHADRLEERARTAHLDERDRIMRDLEVRLLPRIRSAFTEFHRYRFDRYRRGEGAARFVAAVDGLVDALRTLREINGGLRRRRPPDSG